MTDFGGTLNMLIEDLLDAVFVFLGGVFELVAELFARLGIGN